MANNTNTATRTNPATAPSMAESSPISNGLEDNRGCAVDTHDGDVVTGFVDIVVVERPCRPDLAVELHLALVPSHPIEHQGALALQGLHRFWETRALGEPAPQCGPHQHQK